MGEKYTDVKNIELIHVNAIIITGVFILIALGVSSDLVINWLGQDIPLNQAVGWVIIPFAVSSMILLVTGGFALIKRGSGTETKIEKIRQHLHNWGLVASMLGFLYLILLIIGISSSHTS